MQKFRKKPVVVEAIRWTEENEGEVYRFMGEARTMGGRGPLIVPTLEGEMLAYKDDWIIKGVAGEFYPCKPDIFEATYEAVEE